MAFEAIAPVYDDFTSHHDYELWLGNLFPKLVGNGLTGKRLLDVGCGTGKSFIPLLARGWEVTACDISASMVELARAKVGDRARLSVADMRELPVFGEFDLVMCLDDAVNYLLDDDELQRALAGMARNLAPTGLLIFDANTMRPYRTFFAEEIVVDVGDRQLLWHGQSSTDAKPGSIYEATFEVVPPDPAVTPHVHRQRHFSEREVLLALGRAGLEILDVFGHDQDAVPQQPLDESRHTKAIYIARSI